MKPTLRSAASWKALTLLGLLLPCACENARDGNVETTVFADEPLAEPPPERPALPVAREEVLELRRDARGFVPRDYTATDTTLRLFGTELGDGSRPKRAIFADTHDWSTRAYAEGELVGRGHRVERVDEAAVTLGSADGARREVRAGSELRLRLVSHRADRVTRSLGRHRYFVDTAAARAATADDEAPAAFDLVEVYGAPAVRILDVPPGGLLDGAHIARKDLIVALDGAPASSSTPADLASALTSETGSVRVDLLRHGVPMRLVYLRGNDAARPLR